MPPGTIAMSCSEAPASRRSAARSGAAAVRSSCTRDSSVARDQRRRSRSGTATACRRPSSRCRSSATTLMNATAAIANVSQSSHGRNGAQPLVRDRRVVACAAGRSRPSWLRASPSSPTSPARPRRRSAPSAVCRSSARLHHVREHVGRRERREDAERALLAAERARLEHDRRHLHAARLQRAQRRHPRLVRRWRDHDDRRVPPEAPRLVRQQVAERHIAPGARHRQRLQDARVLLQAALRLDDVEAAAERHEADACGSPSGSSARPTRRCARRTPPSSRRPRRRARPRSQIEDHPDVARRIQLEHLHHQVAGARRARPVDAVEAVAELVRPHAGRVRRHVVRAPAEAPLARQVRRRAPKKFGSSTARGYTSTFCARPYVARVPEQPERVARRDLDRPDGVQPAPPRSSSARATSSCRARRPSRRAARCARASRSGRRPRARSSRASSGS